MTSTSRYDVLVAGGGPAGLSAAFAAASGGLRVAVFERSKEIGYPIHTSGGSWLHEMRQFGIPERLMHPIRTGRFIAPAAEATFTYDEPVSCILDVRGLYQFLALQAAKAGANIFPGIRVERIVLSHNRPCGLRVHPGGEVFAPLLIDATGMAGILARQLGLRRDFARYGLGAECDVVASEWPQDTITLLFGSLVGAAGYGWIFPHGDERVRIGVGLIHPDTRRDPRTALDQLLTSLRQGDTSSLRISFQSMLEYHTGATPSCPPLEKTSVDGLLVAGDAGALVSTLLGEGIRFAIATGRMAGEIAIQAHEANRFDAGFLSRFDHQWQSQFGRLFALAHWVNRRLAQFDDQAWNEKIHWLSHLPAESIPPLLKGEWQRLPVLSALWRHRKLIKTWL